MIEIFSDIILINPISMTEEEFEAPIFHDLFGRELDTHKYQYCGEVKPAKAWSGNAFHGSRSCLDDRR